MNEDLVLIKKLEYLRGKHREIDAQINQQVIDEFSRKRMQKEKLSLRDQIAYIEQILYPNATA